MLVTLEQRAALRYVKLTQNEEYSPETRGRFRAKVAYVYGPLTFDGDGKYLFCLHLSFFLFAAGLLIYFFNINRATFGAVVWWVAITTVLYTIISVRAISQCNMLYVTPFSPMILRVYLGVLHAMVKVFSRIKLLHGLSVEATEHHLHLSDRYEVGVIEGNAKLLEDAASKPSWNIDAEILERMLNVVGEDHKLEALFEAIPGFCDSKLVQNHLLPWVGFKLRRSLVAFLDRTFSSHLVPESVRNDRLITCLNAAHSALGPIGVSHILANVFDGHRDEALKSVEIGHSLVWWDHNSDGLYNPVVRRLVAPIITGAQDRNDRWTTLVKEVFGVPDEVFRDYLARGDSVLLAVLIHVTHGAFLADHLERGILESLSRFDIHNTAAELQQDFCTLWNAIVQEAKNDRFGSTRTQILAGIRHLFAPLHQGTNASPNQFPAPLDSIDDSDPILSWPPLYPSCNIPGHHPDLAAQAPPPPSIIRRHSEPAIGVSVVQRPQSSHRLGCTKSYGHLPAVPWPTQPGCPPKSALRPALVRPPPFTNSRDVVTKDAMPDFADISGTADPNHGSTSRSGPIVRREEETRPAPISVVPGFLPSPFPTPALSHSAISAMPPSSIDPAPEQTQFLHRPPEAPTLTTTPSSPHVSNQHLSPGIARDQDYIRESPLLTPRTDHRQPPPDGPTAP